MRRAWAVAFAADVGDADLAACLAYLDAQTAHFAADPAPETDGTAGTPPDLEALASLCQTLLGSNRFLYVD